MTPDFYPQRETDRTSFTFRLLEGTEWLVMTLGTIGAIVGGVLVVVLGIMAWVAVLIEVLV